MRKDSANGYFSDFEIYTGASNTPEKGLGAGVVRCPTAILEGKHHQVFFSGIDLFSELLDDGVYACGTLITNCLHFPPELKPLTKKRANKVQRLKLVRQETSFSLYGRTTRQ